MRITKEMKEREDKGEAIHRENISLVVIHNLLLALESPTGTKQSIGICTSLSYFQRMGQVALVGAKSTVTQETIPPHENLSF